MTITKEELREMIEKEEDIEKVSSVSSDGKSLMIRIPKQIANELDIKAGSEVQWKVDTLKKHVGLEFST